jgi:hypothetical protein
VQKTNTIFLKDLIEFNFLYIFNRQLELKCLFHYLKFGIYEKEIIMEIEKKGSSYKHVLGLYGHVQIFGLESRIHVSLVPCLPLLAKCF